jgi:hypothetical protein
MTKKIIIALITLILLVAAAGAGCVAIPSSQPSQAYAYASAYSNYTKYIAVGNETNASPTYTYTSNIVNNGTDAVQLTIVIRAATPGAMYGRCSTDTFALNIKQFDTITDASNFFNSTSFGYYTQGITERAAPEYQQVMGRAPTLSRYASTTNLGPGNIFLEQHILQQQDEFVLWGTFTAAGSNF